MSSSPSSSPSRKKSKLNAKVSASRNYWDSFSSSYEEMNKRITIKGSKELHRHLQLSDADVKQVLEVACGGGIGTLDIISYLNPGTNLLATDFSPEMIKQAKSRLNGHASVGDIQLSIKMANSLDLSSVSNGSMDRYISSLCLQLVPDPDMMLTEARRVLKKNGLAGFSVWGKPENSGLFTIMREAAVEMKTDGAAVLHANFNFQFSDIISRVKRAGFQKVILWPYMAILEACNSDKYVDFFFPFMEGMIDEGQSREQFNTTVRRVAKEWIDKGKPIGMELIFILARP